MTLLPHPSIGLVVAIHSGGGRRWNGGHSLVGGEAVSVVDCVEVDLLHPCALWWNVIDIIVCLPFGVDHAVLYYGHCLWTSGGWSKFLGEWASLRYRMVLL